MSRSMLSIRNLIARTLLDKLETKLLLRHVLNYTSAQLIMFADNYVLEAQYTQFRRLVEQRLSGVPLNYLLGLREFYSHEFKVTPDTLIPRPETELLVDNVLALAKPLVRILDLGTGSGCIAISCKLALPEAEIVACDKYPATLAVAQENALKLNANVEFSLSDWFSNIKGKFDIIVSNPPYIANDDIHLHALIHEPINALTDFADGLCHYQTIISQAQHYLNAGGCLLLEHGFNQALAITALLAQYEYMQVITLQDYAGCDRITKAFYKSDTNK